MVFERPTLAQLIARGRADIESRLDGADAHLRRTFEDVIALVAAGMTHGLHGHIIWAARQLIADTADETFLVRQAGEYGVERIGAQPAYGPILITGEDGFEAPAGTQWRRSDGVVYELDDDAKIDGVTTFQVTATPDYYGAQGNAEVGQALSIVTPITGVDSTAIVSAPGLQNGADLESLESLLSRLLQRKRQPPKGGGPGDYVRWAREVAGVTRAYELPGWLGVGTVGVTFLTDGELSIIPTAPKVAEVQAYLDSKAPVTAEVIVFAPVPVTQNIVLSTLTPNTAAVQAAVTAELEDLWFRKAAPGGTILLSQINEAISIATGEEDHVLTTPAGNVTASAAGISVLGTITFPS